MDDWLVDRRWRNIVRRVKSDIKTGMPSDHAPLIRQLSGSLAQRRREGKRSWRGHMTAATQERRDELNRQVRCCDKIGRKPQSRFCWQRACCRPNQPRPDRQPFRLGMLAELLTVAGGPNWAFLLRLEDGVSLGVDETMDRTPEVFEQKTKRNLEERFEPGAAEAPDYRSAAEYSTQVEELFTLEAEGGWILKLTNEQASREYGERLHIATPAAIDEGDKVRVIHDGPNRVMVGGAPSVATGAARIGPTGVGLGRQSSQGTSPDKGPAVRLRISGVEQPIVSNLPNRL